MAIAIETFSGPKIEVTPRCFIVPTNSGIDKYLEEQNGFKREDIEDLNLSIIYATKPKNHPGSEAEYYEETNSGEFCGVIRARRSTSAHSHKVNRENPNLSISESYKVIGEFAVYQEGLGWTMLSGTFEKPDELYIQAGVAHFGQAIRKSAITIINMQNAGLYTKDEWHIPEPSQHNFKNSAILDYLTYF